jgi:hypothetical protein
VLVNALTATSALAVDDTNLYWAQLATAVGSNSSGLIARCNKTSCGTGTSVLVSGLLEPFDIVLDPPRMYYPAGDGIEACDEASCAPVLVAPGPLTSRVAVDDTDVYFLGGVGIFTCPKAGCTTPTEAVAFGISAVQSAVADFAMDDTDVYWPIVTYTNGILDPIATIQSCPKTGCVGAARTVASVPYPNTIALYGSDVYITSGSNETEGSGSILRCAKAGCSTPETMAGSLSHPIALTVDASGVYWIDEGTVAANLADGDVGVCPLSGCPSGPTFLATDQPSPGAVATDDACVYWAQSPDGAGNGAILRASK